MYERGGGAADFPLVGIGASAGGLEAFEGFFCACPAGTDRRPELQAVLDTLVPCERELKTTDGTWYLARIKPYRTLDNADAGDGGH